MILFNMIKKGLSKCKVSNQPDNIDNLKTALGLELEQEKLKDIIKELEAQVKILKERNIVDITYLYSDFSAISRGDTREISVIASLKTEEEFHDDIEIPTAIYCVQVFQGNELVFTVPVYRVWDGGIESEVAGKRRYNLFAMTLNIADFIATQIHIDLFRGELNPKINRYYEDCNDYFKDISLPCNFKRKPKVYRYKGKDYILENMSLREMEDVNIFYVYIDEESKKALLHTTMCNIGGCYMNGIPFDTYEQAVIEGTRRTLEKQGWEKGACSECLNYLETIESDRDDQLRDLKNKYKKLKGTGDKIVEIISARCIKLRKQYDSIWNIIVSTDKEETKEIGIVFYDTDDINPYLVECITTGDIESLNKEGLIRYD